MHSYIVAFAVQETYDESAAQEVLINKKNSENNENSLKTVPSNSIINTQSVSSNINAPNANVTIKIEQDKQHGDIKKTPSQTGYCNADITIKEGSSDGQSFSISKHQMKRKDGSKTGNQRFAKKKQCTSKIQNINFRYKKHGKFNGKRRSPACLNLRQGLYSSSITNVVSKDTLLRQMPGQGNLLDIPDHTLMWDDDSMNESDNASISLSISTDPNASLLSYSSEDTLRNASTASSEPAQNLGSMNSVVKVSSEDNVPHKVDVLNVTVAYKFHPNKVTKRRLPPNVMLAEGITRTATPSTSKELLTSEPSNSTIKGNQVDTTLKNCKSEISSKTLTALATQSQSYVLNDEIFAAESSSEAKQLRFISNHTLTSSSDNLENFAILRDSLVFTEPKLTSKPHLDIATNLYPDVKLSINSKVDIVYDYRQSRDISCALPCSEYPKNINNLNNILHKPRVVQEPPEIQKIINLPDENIIKILLDEKKKSEDKLFKEEINKFPTTLPDLWNRIVVVLDLSVKKLEESLTEKIVREISKLLPLSEKLTRPIPDLVLNEKESAEVPVIETMLHKQIQAEKKPPTVDQCHQHGYKKRTNKNDFILNQSLGSFMQDLPSSSSRNIRKPKLLKDIIEVLKPPAFDRVVADPEKGDSINVATEISVADAINYYGLSQLKLIYLAPFKFIKENTFVLGAVPIFFIVLLCLYLLTVFVLNP